MNERSDLIKGLETAYIDGSVVSETALRPQFVSNDHREGRKVLSSIEEELLRCDHFQISVAFITMSGLTPLLQTLKELEQKGIPGEILTTNYLNFSEDRALLISATATGKTYASAFVMRELGFHSGRWHYGIYE